MAIIFALLLPCLCGVAGLAVDYSRVLSVKAHLQGIADASALSAARGFVLSDKTNGEIKAAAINIAQNHVKSANLAKFTKVSADVELDTTVHVELNSIVEMYFASVMGYKQLDVSANASARVVGQTKLCLLALDPSNSSTVFLDKNARITANECAVYANSTDERALYVNSLAELSASLICSGGGHYGNRAGAYNPQPVNDCPRFDDPIAHVPEPTPSICREVALELTDGSHILQPGTYCDGIKIAGNAQVTLAPGVFIITGDKFLVQDSATLTGENVGIYLADESTLIEFTEDTTISLTAPKSGALAGLLFFETRSAPRGRLHRINSNNARVLLGTIYFPRGHFRADAKAPIADRSAYTTIIANKVEVNEEPHLILNSDYTATDIPVPATVRGDKVVLIN